MALLRSRVVWIGAAVVLIAALLAVLAVGLSPQHPDCGVLFRRLRHGLGLVVRLCRRGPFGPTFLIGLGAYTAAILNSTFGLPIPLCVIVAAFAAVAGGILLAVPALRLRGPYFGLVTLVAVLLLQNFIVIFASVTGGEIGMTVPDVLSIDASVNYWYALAFLVVCAALLYGLSRSAVGLILQASGQDAVGAAALGFNVTKHKVAAFCVSALFSGTAGAMLIFYMGTASVDTVVDVAIAVQIIIAAVLGGRRTILGAALGAVFLIVANEFLRPLGRAQHFRRRRHRARRDPVLSRGPARLRAASRRTRMSGAVRLQVSGLGKRFGGVVAVKNMNFDLRAGEITGLIGPNGSGKSTVMSLIMGLVRANSGAVKLDGVDIAGWPAHRIARAGVSIVFQHSRPLQRQTVLENVKLALLPDSLLRLATEATAAQRARAIAERVGLGGVLQRHPWTLPFADLRRMELAKAVARDPKVVLIDEPFAGLTTTEIKVFSDLIRTLRDEGRAVLLVDHSVKSVAALADRVIAMYLGERIAEGSADEVMQNETVRRVYIGGAIEAVERKGAAAEAAATLLDVDAVEVFYGKANALDRVALRVQQDEFVSIVGLNGAGKTTLFNAISGLVPYRGAIRFAGRDLKSLTAAAIARAGVVHCPETRELFGYMSVRENLDLGGGHLSKAERERQLAWVFDLFPILEQRQTQAARTLSGGEQQMLTLGRALMMQPKLLILDEPTLGLAPVILGQLSKAIERLRQERSLTLLLAEQNVTFALPHSDRVYVLDHGRITWHGDPVRFAQEMSAGYL